MAKSATYRSNTSAGMATGVPALRSCIRNQSRVNAIFPGVVDTGLRWSRDDLQFTYGVRFTPKRHYRLSLLNTKKSSLNFIVLTLTRVQSRDRKFEFGKITEANRHVRVDANSQDQRVPSSVTEVL